MRLNTIGAIESLNESKVTLRNGLEVESTSGDFFPTKGIVEYSEAEHIWVARFDINDLFDREIVRHPSDDWRKIVVALINVAAEWRVFQEPHGGGIPGTDRLLHEEARTGTAKGL